MVAITIPYERRHQARHGDIIDSTKRAKGLRKCPKCGRYGQRVVYVKHGIERYIHKERYDTMYYTVTDSCHIPPPFPQEPEQGRKIIEQEMTAERAKCKRISRMVHGCEHSFTETIKGEGLYCNFCGEAAAVPGE